MNLSENTNIKHPKKINLKLSKQMFFYLKKHWTLLMIAFCMLLITSFLNGSLIPLLNLSLISCVENANTSLSTVPFNELVINVDFIFGLHADMNIFIFISIYICVIPLMFTSLYFTYFSINVLEMRVANDLRKDCFRKIQTLSFSYFDKTPSGWIIARIQNDTNAVSEMIGWCSNRFLWATFDLVFLLITMFSVSWQLTLVLLMTTPLVLIIFPIFTKLILKYSRAARDAYSNFIRWLNECINGVSTIKSLSLEDATYEECKVIVQEIKLKLRKSHIYNACFSPLINLISTLTLALFVLAGDYLLTVDGGTIVISASILILFINSTSKIYYCIADFTELYGSFAQNQASAEKVFSLLDTKPELIDNSQVIDQYGDIFNPKEENYEKIQGDIEFKNISFFYDKELPIYKNLNLTIEEGTSVAIVGETGGGKTTLVNLLCRFYKQQDGEILINGKNIEDRSTGWLRSNIAYVLQNPYIFEGTFEDNIKYGKLNATDKEVKAASMLVDIDSFISSFKEGYKAKLCENGDNISLGQKQLITFARAIIRNPSILILDEATSSIDSETEEKIQQAINVLLKNRTSIVIAHRLSTIINCDRILFMENGNIVEDGNHKELMSLKGKYFHLYMSQFKDLSIDQQFELFEAENNV